jgi:FlaA1/EpsC-like NDP-sugar epimerase
LPQAPVPYRPAIPRLLRSIESYRRIIVVAIHVLLIALANYLAFWLRFDGQIPPNQYGLMTAMLPLLVVIRTATFVPFRLYEGLWRYTGIWDLRNIITAGALSTLLFWALVHGGFGETNYPRSVFIIDAVLLIFFMGGIRLTRRIYRELAPGERELRVLIFGAGDAGEMVVRDMKNNEFYEYEPVGFVDDDVAKVGQRIHGVPVLGTRANLAEIIHKAEPHEVLVAMPRAESATLRGVLRALEPFKVPIKTLPNISDILGGRVAVSQIRTLSLEDLLRRPPVGLDPVPVVDLIAGRRVLVTGAGGSIGSELSRQVAAVRPSALILLERYENSLYTITNDVEEHFPDTRIEPVIADVTDIVRLDSVFRQHRPHVVFHAAAHKHVPMMELHPCEAVKNNVFGSRAVAEAACRHGVERFILISSDKAVNPSSVMGATKRVAELMMQELGKGSSTCFTIVRFGNVLASNGSVVPRFMEQIKAGGPVTVTHPEMRRFFMLIPEAVQLVLHAAALGESGAVYVLDMGDEISVAEMARDLIRLSGFIPDEEIEIKFTGLRPGEKLFEELCGADECLEPSRLDKVQRVRSFRSHDFGDFWGQVRDLERDAAADDVEAAIRGLRALVPTFEASSSTSCVPS